MPELGGQNGAGADLPLENRGDRFVICTIVGEYYALPSRFISEVALFDRVYPLPLLPDYVLGVINRYSVPFALLDMGLLISGRPSFGAKALILKEPEAGERVNLEKTAFCIDDVIDIVEIALTDLLPLEKGDGVESSFSWKGRNVLVLDIRGIIDRVAGEIAA